MLANKEFHEFQVDLAGNSFLSDMYRRLCLHQLMERTILVLGISAAGGSSEEHEAIVAAFERHDLAAARDALRRNVETGKAIALEALIASRRDALMSFVTTRDGTRLRASDRGAGPAVVLVHGWKMSHRIWDRTVASLEDRYRVVSFDLRGMGESDKPGSRYDFDELASDLGEVIDQLGLARCDTGRMVDGLLRLAGVPPSQGGAGVARLALVNGPIRLTQTRRLPVDDDGSRAPVVSGRGRAALARRRVRLHTRHLP